MNEKQICSISFLAGKLQLSRVWPILVTATMIVGMGGDLFAAPPAELTVKQIYEKAQQWHDSIKSGFIEYDCTQREVTEIPNGVIYMPGSWHRTFTFDLKNGRRKVDQRLIESFKPAIPSPTGSIHLFDGNKAATVEFGTTLQQMKIVVISSENEKSEQADIDNYCNAVLQIPLTDTQKSHYDKLYWYPHALRDKGLNCRVLPTQEAVDGQWCHVVEFPGVLKLWIDPKINCACRKSERTDGNKDKPILADRTTASDFTEVVKGLWLPKQFHIEMFMPSDSPTETKGKVWLDTVLKVNTIRINDITDQDFRLKVDADVPVWDKEHDRMFKASGKGDDIMKELEKK